MSGEVAAGGMGPVGSCLLEGSIAISQLTGPGFGPPLSAPGKLLRKFQGCFTVRRTEVPLCGLGQNLGGGVGRSDGWKERPGKGHLHPTYDPDLGQAGLPASARPRGGVYWDGEA